MAARQTRFSRSGRRRSACRPSTASSPRISRRLSTVSWPRSWPRSRRLTGAAEPPTFANTIEALERSGRGLERVGDVFSNLTLERDQPRARRDRPRLRAEASGASQQDRARPRAVRADRRGLPRARRARLGARPAAAVGRGTICASCAPARCSGPRRRRGWPRSPTRMASLHTHFGQNVQHDEDEWRLVLDEADLDGLPNFARDAAAEAAGSAVSTANTSSPCRARRSSRS